MEIVFVVALACIALVSVVALVVNSRNQSSIKNIERQIANSKITLPLRLQAHERCLILLERISPDSLLVRIGQAETVSELQVKLLSSIRSEFEHNLSQQLYIEPEVWSYIVNAKNNIVGLINACCMKLNPTDKGMELSKLILESYANLETPPTALAKSRIKQAAAELY